MSENEDKGYLVMFGAVFGALVLFTAIIMVLANMISPPSATSEDPLVAAQLKERLMPIGQSRIEQ